MLWWLQVWIAADSWTVSSAEQTSDVCKRPAADKILGADLEQIEAEEIVDMLVYSLVWLQIHEDMPRLSDIKAQQCISRLLGEAFAINRQA